MDKTLEASQIACEPYDRARLRALLADLRALTVKPPSVFWPQLRAQCASVGIALVIVPEVKGARASGATRWISPIKAVVQLSNRGKRNDKFWFAFFHELGHVLLHGKREVFVEDKIGYDGGRLAQEREANDFAGELLIPRQYEAELASLHTLDDVSAFALELGIASGIVAGRLQHERQDYRFGHDQFEKFEIVRTSDTT